jgi:hypothetical protein
MLHSDSIASSAILVGLGALGFLWSLERRRKWAESIIWLLLFASSVLPSLGYDLKVPWILLDELAVGVSASLVIFGLIRYGRRELSEGEYDIQTGDFEPGS